MRKDKNHAVKLRLQGKSYLEISRILNVPKSTLSGWLSNLVISDKARSRIQSRAHKKSTEALIKRNKKQTELAIVRMLEVRKIAKKEVGRVSRRDLFILGISIYWAEGYKRPLVRNGRELTHHVVSLTNSDPYIIKIFLKFLRDYCKIPENKIKASIRIFQHQNEILLLKFWQKETGIVKDNFRKTYYGISKSSLDKRPFNRLPYGVIQVVVADTVLFHKIMGYIEGIKKLL